MGKIPIDEWVETLGFEEIRGYELEVRVIQIETDAGINLVFGGAVDGLREISTDDFLAVVQQLSQEVGSVETESPRHEIDTFTHPYRTACLQVLWEFRLR